MILIRLIQIRSNVFIYIFIKCQNKWLSVRSNGIITLTFYFYQSRFATVFDDSPAHVLVLLEGLYLQPFDLCPFIPLSHAKYDVMVGGCLKGCRLISIHGTALVYKRHLTRFRKIWIKENNQLKYICLYFGCFLRLSARQLVFPTCNFAQRNRHQTMTEGSCAVPISRLDLHYDDPYVGIVECCPGNSSVMLNPYVYQCYNKKVIVYYVYIALI